VLFHITPWEQGISWRLQMDRSNTPCHYYDAGNLTLSQFLNHEDWTRTLPLEVLKAAIQFEKTYQKHAIAALWLASRNLYAQERFINEPFLFFLAVDYGVKHRYPAEKLFELFVQKRSETFKLYQLPPEKRLIKFFKKFFSRAFNESKFHQVVQLIRQHGIDRVCVIQNIHQPFLNSLESTPDLLDYPAFLRIETLTDIKHILMLILDIRQMSEALNKPYHLKLKTFKRIAQIKGLHTRCVKEINNKYKEGANNPENIKNIFPSPPNLLENPNIQYIYHLSALIQEGVEMNNCVATYAEKILSRKYFVFKVLKPQRATLGLAVKQGKLSVDQLYLKSNKMPSEETIDYVNSWLRQSLSSHNPPS